MLIFKFKKNFGKFLCKSGSHNFEMLNILNSYNSHPKGHIGLRLVGDFDMTVNFEHKKCRRCDLEINEIEQHNLESNE